MTPTPYKTYLPVNWADGMKINKFHFRSEQQAGSWQQALASRAWLNEFNYGLLPGPEDTGRQIILSTDNQQQVSIRLLSCHAITSGGHLVYINDGSMNGETTLAETVPGLQLPYHQLAARETVYYVVLAVDPFNRVPAGQPDVEETQLRPPYTMPAYRLELVEEIRPGGAGDFYLPLGRIRIADGKILPDETYIPPCTSVAAHRALRDTHAAFEQFFSSMELYTLQIQQKIIQRRQPNDLSSVIMEICDKLNVYMSGEYQRMKQVYAAGPPINLFQPLAGLARLLKNAIDIYTGTLKDELLNYIAEWCGISQGELETSATAMANHRYNHVEIREAELVARRFSELVLQLFKGLAALEYIGKKREAGIFVKEQLIGPKEEATAGKRKSFLAD